jgi:hypothetical protein
MQWLLLCVFTASVWTLEIRSASLVPLARRSRALAVEPKQQSAAILPQSGYDLTAGRPVARKRLSAH